MENQQKPSKKITINYGIYLALALIVFALAMYAMGKTYDRSWYIQVTGIVIMAVFVVLGIKELKKSNNGLLTLGQGLKTGVGIALISAIIYVLYTVVFVKFVEPGFIDNVIEMQREQMLDNPNMSEEMIESMETNTQKYFWPFTIGGILIFNIFIGFVISLIASLAMQKKED